MSELDPRVVVIEIDSGGTVERFTDLSMSASGTKFGNANQNECTIKITNLQKSTRNRLITETSPFNKNKKQRDYRYTSDGSPLAPGCCTWEMSPARSRHSLLISR